MRGGACVWCGEARRMKAWAAVKASDVEAAGELLIGFITVRLQVRPSKRHEDMSGAVPPTQPPRGRGASCTKSQR